PRPYWSSPCIEPVIPARSEALLGYRFAEPRRGSLLASLIGKLFLGERLLDLLFEPIQVPFSLVSNDRPQQRIDRRDGVGDIAQKLILFPSACDFPPGLSHVAEDRPFTP